MKVLIIAVKLQNRIMEVVGSNPEKGNNSPE
jgi:hypothetical protein